MYVQEINKGIYFLYDFILSLLSSLFYFVCVCCYLFVLKKNQFLEQHSTFPISIERAEMGARRRFTSHPLVFSKYIL